MPKVGDRICFLEPVVLTLRSIGVFKYERNPYFSEVVKVDGSKVYVNGYDFGFLPGTYEVL